MQNGGRLEHSTCTLIDATRTAVSTQLAKGSPRAKLQGERERAEEVRGVRHTITMMRTAARGTRAGSGGEGRSPVSKRAEEAIAGTRGVNSGDLR
jgi:hypothetical protein